MQRRSQRAAAGRASSRYSRRGLRKARRSSWRPEACRRSPGRRRSRSGSGARRRSSRRRSRLTLTLASSSTAQSWANLLILDLPLAQSARARVGTAILEAPGHADSGDEMTRVGRMRAQVWTGAVGTAALVGSRSRAGGDCRLHVTEARGDADGDLRRPQGVGRAGRRRDGAHRDQRACRIDAHDRRGGGCGLGRARAIIKSLDNFGIDVPIEGQVVVAPPGQVTPGRQACIGSSVPIATWLLTGSALGRRSACRCTSSPSHSRSSAPGLRRDLPAALGRAPRYAGTSPPQGAKVYSAELTINGVFGKVNHSTWISSWVPYNPGQVTPDSAGAVVAPAAIAPGAVTLSAQPFGRRSGDRLRDAGR